MGDFYNLRPVTADFIKAIEDLTPDALSAYMMPRLSAETRSRASNPFIAWLFSPSAIYLGREMDWDIPASGKPLFNRPETQDIMAQITPYVIDRKGLALLRLYYQHLLEETTDALGIRWYRKDILCLRSIERRYTLAILFVG